MELNDLEQNTMKLGGELEDEPPFYIMKFTAHTILDAPQPDLHILKYKGTILDTSPVTGVVHRVVGHYDVWRFNVDAYR